jgi:hypothetical protein
MALTEERCGELRIILICAVLLRLFIDSIQDATSYVCNVGACDFVAHGCAAIALQDSATPAC